MRMQIVVTALADRVHILSVVLNIITTNSQGVLDKTPRDIMSTLRVVENASILYSFYKPNLWK